MATRDGTGDWRDGINMFACINHLLMSEHLTDVTFTFVNDVGAVVKGHRLLLAARSVVFEAMFYGPMKETATVVNIEDIEANIFKMMVWYIYSDRVRLTGNNVLPCLYAAQKYSINGMVQICAEFLENQMSIDNVCSILQHVTLYDKADIVDSCLDYIGENLDDVLKVEEFEDLSQSLVTKVLSNEGSDTTEIERFQGLHRWARAQCKIRGIDESPTNIRHEMGDALYQIRLPLIPVANLNSVVVDSAILRREETDALTKYITGESKKQYEVCGFSSSPRQSMEYMVNLTPPEIKAPGKKYSIVEVRVQTSHKLYLKSLYLSRPIPVTAVTRYRNGHEPTCDIKKVFKNQNMMIAFRPLLWLPSGETELTLWFGTNKCEASCEFRQDFSCFGANGAIVTSDAIRAVRFVNNK